MKKVPYRLCRLLCGLGVFTLPAISLAAIIVTDDAGKRISLGHSAQRIISLAPHTTEMLFAAGAGDKVVGVVSYSDYPPEASKLPEVGSYKQFDFERITALKPDLIVGWVSGNPPRALEQLERLGFAVYRTEPRVIDDIASNVERLAQLAGSAKAAQGTIEDFRRGVQTLAEKYRQAEPVSFFYQVWNDPLMTLNGEHLFSDVAALCGGRNVFAELPALAPRISVEAVLAKDPQTIIASGMDAERPEWLDDWKRWPSLQAVKYDQLYFVPPDIIQRHTPRILQGAQQLCAHLDSARQDYHKRER